MDGYCLIIGYLAMIGATYLIGLRATKSQPELFRKDLDFTFAALIIMALFWPIVWVILFVKLTGIERKP